MSQAMSLKELGNLLHLIESNYAPFTKNGFTGCVKYIDPHIDMRNSKCFALTLRGYGWEKVFHTQNECRELPDSLYDRVVYFLETGKNDKETTT